jgi:hypothetical protein
MQDYGDFLLDIEAQNYHESEEHEEKDCYNSSTCTCITYTCAAIFVVVPILFYYYPELFGFHVRSM